MKMANRMFNLFRRLDPILIDELKSRYLAGEKHTVIEAEMGISNSTLVRYVYLLGLPMRQPQRGRRYKKNDARGQGQASDQQAAEQT
jgi:hypothetical protein